MLQSPVVNPKARDCDLAGCGYFGADRRGHEKHKGLDIIALPFTKISAPISGVVRTLFVYENSSETRGIEIANGNIKVKLFYVSTNLTTGQKVKVGDFLGLAQDVAAYHNSLGKMTPHVHMELFINNVAVDPKTYFNL